MDTGVLFVVPSFWTTNTLSLNSKTRNGMIQMACYLSARLIIVRKMEWFQGIFL